MKPQTALQPRGKLSLLVCALALSLSQGACGDSKKEAPTKLEDLEAALANTGYEFSLPSESAAEAGNMAVMTRTVRLANPFRLEAELEMLGRFREAALERSKESALDSRERSRLFVESELARDMSEFLSRHGPSIKGTAAFSVGSSMYRLDASGNALKVAQQRSGDSNPYAERLEAIGKLQASDEFKISELSDLVDETGAYLSHHGVESEADLADEGARVPDTLAVWEVRVQALARLAALTADQKRSERVVTPSIDGRRP